MKEFLKTAEDIVGDDRNMQAYANEQTYIALSSMMLSAAMLKIDSCTIGGMDKKAVEKEGYSTEIPMVITNGNEYLDIVNLSYGKMNKGQEVIKAIK